METSEQGDGRTRIALIGLGVLACVALIGLYFGLRSPPQLGTSEEVYHTVDALYTAVRNEDVSRVDDCERRLKAAFENKSLPSSAWGTLQGVIASARSGNWGGSAKSLYAFMRGQRRDGEPKSPRAKRK